MGWGREMGCYVLDPYCMVKEDGRNREMGKVEGVMDGVRIVVFVVEEVEEGGWKKNR